MPVYSFANNLDLISAFNNENIVTTDPLPIGDANNIFLTLNIHHLMAMVGTPAPSVDIFVQQSNDGQNWETSAISLSGNAAGTTSTVGVLTAVFIRLQITQAVNGAAGDWTAATFDIHGNLKHI